MISEYFKEIGCSLDFEQWKIPTNLTEEDFDSLRGKGSFAVVATSKVCLYSKGAVIYRSIGPIRANYIFNDYSDYKVYLDYQGSDVWEKEIVSRHNSCGYFAEGL